MWEYQTPRCQTFKLSLISESVACFPSVWQQAVNRPHLSHRTSFCTSPSLIPHSTLPSCLAIPSLHPVIRFFFSLTQELKPLCIPSIFHNIGPSSSCADLTRSDISVSGREGLSAGRESNSQNNINRIIRPPGIYLDHFSHTFKAWYNLRAIVD